MPTLTPYSLRFQGGLHIGTRGVNLEEAGVSIPSDTLFAALVDVVNRAGEDVAAFAEAYLANPPFLLTSAFPFAGDVRFYPMPANLAGIFSPKTFDRYGKTLNRIRYLSEGLLLEAAKGGPLDAWLFPTDETETPKSGVTLQSSALWLKVDEIQKLPKTFRREEKQRHALPRLRVWAASQTPRVTLDRVNSSSSIFHAGKVEFAQDCGLWFGVRWRDAEAEFGGRKFKAAFEQAIAILSKDGLGGERTTGYGAFAPSQNAPVSLPEPAAGGLMYLLSRYHPRPEEIPQALADPRAAYRLTAVGGWLRTFGGASQRRKRLFLVDEGSLLPGSVAGQVVDIRPTYKNAAGEEVSGIPHPIYRSGLALGLGWPG